MPQFEPGSVHGATITFSNPKSVGFDFEAILCMGDGWEEKASASFHLDAGQSKPMTFQVTMPSTEGTYPVYIKVNSGGFVIATFVGTEDIVIASAALVGIEITGINVSPTTLTAARHEYETSLGLGYWGDPFTISITFANPFDFDVWVKPDYAFGKLAGGEFGFLEGELQGFNAEELLYFRLLLQSSAIEGDYSHATSWQKPYDARGQNTLSNMAFVYDPDGVPRAGDERWIRIPAGGLITNVKDAHLSSDLQVKALQCTTCGEIITGSVEEHYESNHPGVEITCWSWGGLSGCYFTDGSGEAVTTVYVPAEGVAGLHDLCVVAWNAIYFVYDPGCGQTRVGGQIVTLNWRLEELGPVAAAVPDAINITG